MQRILKQHFVARVRYVDHLKTDGDAILKSAYKMSLEGIVSKKLDAPYRSGRTDSCVKSKYGRGQEVVIDGWTTTNGRFRSLLADVYRDRHLVFVGRIGTGFGQAMVDRIMPRLTWSQIDPKLDPARYMVRTVPALLLKSKAWADYCESKRPLEASSRSSARRV